MCGGLSEVSEGVVDWALWGACECVKGYQK